MSWLFGKRTRNNEDIIREFALRVEELNKGFEGFVKEVKEELRWIKEALMEMNQQTKDEALKTLSKVIDQREREFISLQRQQVSLRS